MAYESRKLTSTELNYATHEKELLVVVHAIKVWRPYLESKRFTVVTDHASLEYIKSQHQLSRRQARWLELLQANDFEVRYRPGKTNVVADALSRKPQLSTLTTINVELISNDDLIDLYKNDYTFGPIYNTLINPKLVSKKELTLTKAY
jgi:hypothetical protein